MAGRAGLFDQHQQGVVVAVSVEGHHLLHVPAALSLLPELLTGTAEKPGVAGLQRLLQALPIHVGQHQHLFGMHVLHDGRDEFGLFETAIQVKFRHMI